MELEKTNRPNCYKCKHRSELSFSSHSSCKNENAEVIGNEYGKSKGWFYYPLNFDPVWLESCNGFEEKKQKYNFMF